MHSAHQIFLERQFLNMTLMATAQRGSLYQRDVSSLGKEKFRFDFNFVLKQTTEQYCNGLPESAHITNIAKFADDMSCKHADVLN